MPIIVHRLPFEPGDDKSEDVLTDGSGKPLTWSQVHKLFRRVGSSRKFQKWDASKGTGVFEQHFTPEQLGYDWGVSAETIRILFRNEAGVLRVPSRLAGNKRKYVSLKIPKSVAERVHRRLSATPK